MQTFAGANHACCAGLPIASVLLCSGHPHARRCPGGLPPFDRIAASAASFHCSTAEAAAQMAASRTLCVALLETATRRQCSVPLPRIRVAPSSMQAALDDGGPLIVRAIGFLSPSMRVRAAESAAPEAQKRLRVAPVRAPGHLWRLTQLRKRLSGFVLGSSGARVGSGGGGGELLSRSLECGEG